MNNIPANIEDIVRQMNDEKTSFWIRNNYCITLENIAKYCTSHTEAFHKKAQKQLQKEVKNKR